MKTETTETLQINAELLPTEWKMCQERNQERNWRISRSEWEWMHTIPNIMKHNENNSKLRVYNKEIFQRYRTSNLTACLETVEEKKENNLKSIYFKNSQIQDWYKYKK